MKNASYCFQVMLIYNDSLFFVSFCKALCPPPLLCECVRVCAVRECDCVYLTCNKHVLQCATRRSCLLCLTITPTIIIIANIILTYCLILFEILQFVFYLPIVSIEKVERKERKQREREREKGPIKNNSFFLCNKIKLRLKTRYHYIQSLRKRERARGRKVCE